MGGHDWLWLVHGFHLSNLDGFLRPADQDHGQGVRYFLCSDSTVGAMTFPLICGWAFDASGPQATMIVIFSALLAAAIIYMVVRRIQPALKTE